MLFNEFRYGIFLILVFTIYWTIPNRFRWLILLGASYFFYMCWNVKYIGLIVGTTFVSYLAARMIEGTENRKIKKLVLTGTFIVCIGVLLFFKYFNFLSQSITTVLNKGFNLGADAILVNVLLPVGISFYTFQTLSYVVDVYRGREAEHHFGKYAAFIAFFPQLVAGPIERTDNLLPQIKADHKFDYDRASYGLKLMAWGYFKKIAIADTISKFVSPVFDNPTNYTGFALLLSACLFSIEIYCDFSGYSDIAKGSAKLLDIDLMDNFKSPYFSQSVKEFWSRWHISLSTWFKDYLYIPLGGNRCSKLRNSINVLITFLVSGLWHGANWTFVAWGGIHGLAQVLENLLIPKKYKNSTGLLRWIRFFLVFVFATIAWVLFASNSFSDGAYIITHMFTGIESPAAYINAGLEALIMFKRQLLALLVNIIILAIYDYTALTKNPIELVSSKKLAVRWAVYLILILLLVLSVPVTDKTEFIYFQF